MEKKAGQSKTVPRNIALHVRHVEVWDKMKDDYKASYSIGVFLDYLMTFDNYVKGVDSLWSKVIEAKSKPPEG